MQHRSGAKVKNIDKSLGVAARAADRRSLKKLDFGGQQLKTALGAVNLGRNSAFALDV